LSNTRDGAEPDPQAASTSDTIAMLGTRMV
jgi:hypothetical protein